MVTGQGLGKGAKAGAEGERREKGEGFGPELMPVTLKVVGVTTGGTVVRGEGAWGGWVGWGEGLVVGLMGKAGAWGLSGGGGRLEPVGWPVEQEEIR